MSGKGKHLNIGHTLRLPSWRGPQRPLLEIEQPVRCFPHYHKDSMGCDLRCRFTGLCRVFFGEAPLRAGLVTTPVVELQPLYAREEPLADLPCPWCLAPTHENDAGCPSCGQPFG